MKIEDLNKTQIVLLTLLVSFVTSIATGVVTVSLMEQAPQSVTQTINRVVERTVERVVPAVAGVAGKPTTVTKETTVVVKEEDLITKSIEQMSQSMVAINSRSINSEGLTENTFIGWGIVMYPEGVIVTDSGLIADEGNYAAITEDGVVFGLKIVSQDEPKGIAVLSVIREKGNEKSEKYIFLPATLGDSNILRLGQTAIAFGGKGRKSVSIGIISGLLENESGNISASSTDSTRNIISIETSATPVDDVSGGPLINSFGEVVAMSTQAGLGGKTASYTPVQFLKETASAKAN